MVTGLAFLATAVSTWFAQATLVRFTQRRRPHDLAWSISLACFAVASAALAVGAATGWDRGAFRVFYAFGAIINVPWLALGTLYLLAGPSIGRRVQWALVLLTGFALGVVLFSPMGGTWPSTTIPVGKEIFEPMPRVLAAVSSGLGALVVFGGAAWSAGRFLRGRSRPGTRVAPIAASRLAAANLLIALGTLVLSSGGTLQGIIGHDEAFALSLAIGIVVIYAGFLVADRRPNLGADAPGATGAEPVVTNATPDATPSR